MIGSTSQKSLHETWLSLDDDAMARASLFPLFDDEGRTQALMLATPGSGQIPLLDFEPGLFYRRPLWRRRLGVRRADLRDSSFDTADPLSDLWHFDPWWVLAAERFSGHPAVPPLKGTNIPGFDKKITHLWFSRDLSRVSWVGWRTGEGLKVKKFQPKYLEKAARQRGAQTANPSAVPTRPGWRLRPWW